MTPFDFFTDPSVSDMAAAIQVAIAPIFLLVGTGAILNVVTARLGRIVDRARALENMIDAGEDARLENRHRDELLVLDKRLKYGNRAVFFCCLAAVFICMLVALVFLLGLFGGAAGGLVALMFILVLGSLITGLFNFLREVTVATRLLRVRQEFRSRSVDEAND